MEGKTVVEIIKNETDEIFNGYGSNIVVKLKGDEAEVLNVHLNFNDVLYLVHALDGIRLVLGL